MHDVHSRSTPQEPLMDDKSRKPYQSPRLETIGELRELTAAGSTGNNEQVAGQGTKSKRPNSGP